MVLVTALYPILVTFFYRVLLKLLLFGFCVFSSARPIKVYAFSFLSVFLHYFQRFILIYDLYFAAIGQDKQSVSFARSALFALDSSDFDEELLPISNALLEGSESAIRRINFAAMCIPRSPSSSFRIAFKGSKLLPPSPLRSCNPSRRFFDLYLRFSTTSKASKSTYVSSDAELDVNSVLADLDAQIRMQPEKLSIRKISRNRIRMCSKKSILEAPTLLNEGLRTLCSGPAGKENNKVLEIQSASSSRNFNAKYV
jgi:hypothetical protein